MSGALSYIADGYLRSARFLDATAKAAGEVSDLVGTSLPTVHGPVRVWDDTTAQFAPRWAEIAAVLPDLQKLVQAVHERRAEDTLGVIDAMAAVGESTTAEASQAFGKSHG